MRPPAGLRRVQGEGQQLHGLLSGWEWVGPDLALDPALLASRPICKAKVGPFPEKLVASSAPWALVADPNSSIRIFNHSNLAAPSVIYMHMYTCVRVFQRAIKSRKEN